MGPARANDVDGAIGQIQRGRDLQHGIGQPEDLLGGLALDPKSDDERCDLGVGGGTGEDLRHRGLRLLFGKVLVIRQMAQQCRPPRELTGRHQEAILAV